MYSSPVLAVNPLLSAADPLASCCRLHHEYGIEFVAGGDEAQYVGRSHHTCLSLDLRYFSCVPGRRRTVSTDVRAAAHGIVIDKALFYRGIWRHVPRRHRRRANVADAPVSAFSDPGADPAAAHEARQHIGIGGTHVGRSSNDVVEPAMSYCRAYHDTQRRRPCRAVIQTWVIPRIRERWGMVGARTNDVTVPGVSLNRLWRVPGVGETCFKIALDHVSPPSRYLSCRTCLNTTYSNLRGSFGRCNGSQRRSGKAPAGIIHKPDGVHGCRSRAGRGPSSGGWCIRW